MTTKMNLNGTTRKALVAAIAEITGERPIYRKMPICNYDIGDITVTKDGNINVDRFLGLVRKYTDIKELNAEIIREFVDQIYVHQTERINGRKIQRIRIVWNCIGEFTPPMSEPEKETA